MGRLEIVNGCYQSRIGILSRLSGVLEMVRYWVYILRCSDNSLYTGITTNLERRVREHNSGSGSKYTRSRAPVAVAYAEPVRGKSRALKREFAIKKMSRNAKLLLCASHPARSD